MREERECVSFSGIAKRLVGIAFGSQADQKSFEKLREFFTKKGVISHMVGFISNLAPLLNYSLVTISLPPSSALLKPESLREG